MLTRKKFLIFGLVIILTLSSFMPSVTSITIETTEASEGETDNGDPPSSTLDDLTVYVKVTKINEIESVDSFNDADFYLKVEIDHLGKQTSPKPLKKNDDTIFFGTDYNWIASREIYGDKKLIDISIQLWDRDTEWYEGGDDHLDITYIKDDLTLDITYDVRTGTWNGEDGGSGHAEGNSGESSDKCEIWFEVYHEGGNSGDELTVDANGPYQGNVGKQLQLNPIAEGGEPPYKNWYWIIFKNGNIIKEYSSENPKITFSEEGTYRALVQVNDQANEHAEDWADIIIKKQEEPSETYAVLVAGGTGDSRILEILGVKELDEYFENDAKLAYDTFKNLGYSDSNIYWMSGARRSDNADAKTTKSNVKSAITSWLKGKSDENSNIFIFLSNHGADLYGGICVFPGRPYNMWEIIFPWELDSWLDQVEYKTCIIMIEGCYSGWFTKYCNGRDRIVLTATDKSSPAYTGYTGSFVRPFFEELEKGSSYGKSWEAADYHIDKEIADDQNPQIEDNGDGNSHGTSAIDKLPIGGDGYLALNTYP